jgi:hypothetical protein
MTHAKIAEMQTAVSARQVAVSEDQLKVQAAKTHIDAHQGQQDLHLKAAQHQHQVMMGQQQATASTDANTNHDNLAKSVSDLAKAMQAEHQSKKAAKPKTRKGTAILPSGGTMKFEMTDS